MRKLAFLLISLGTIGAAVGVARTDPSVDGWVKSFQIHVPLTLLSLAVMGVGVVLQRRIARLTAQAQVGGGQLTIARNALRSVHDQADRLGAEAEQLDLDQLHQRLDAIQAGAVADLIDNRETITSAYGLAAYAAVMGPFAQGERCLNRAWSASTDGYLDEAVDYLRRAQPFLAEACTELDKHAGAERSC
jgi:hypothetical protein